MKSFVRFMCLSVVLMATAAAANAATFVVNSFDDLADATPGDGVCATATSVCTLRAAISEANALAGDDSITLPAGTYTQSLTAANEDLNAGGDWDITSTITINGADQATTIVQAAVSAGTATERVFNVRAGGNLTLNNMTVRNGRFNGTMSTATRGAGIENNGILAINNVTLRDNQINSTSGNPIGAGIHNAGASVSITNSSITNNTNTRVTGGSAFGGGLTSIVAATITISNSSISNNTATSLAGGFGFGSGMYLESTFNVNATNSHFDNNVGSGPSGANGTGIRALSNSGAAVFNATECTFNNNTTSGGPAQGVAVQFFTVTAAGATVTATIERSSISGNLGSSNGVGLNATANGGPITVNLNRSTVANNLGGTNGGGIFASNSGGTASSSVTVNVTNSTLSGNTASANGGGAAFEQVAGGAVALNLNFATVTNNRANNDNTGAESGGGIMHPSGTLNLKNSIVSGNSFGTGGANADISGSAVSGDYNHIGDVTGATISGTTANNTTGDALLGPLANNGGPTLTHLPGAGSPALNAIPSGTNECGTINIDQTGVVRPSGAGCEKGSVEIGAGPVLNFNVGGRVTASGGRGIPNTHIWISGGTLPSAVLAKTNAFGYYNFPNIAPGTYTLTIAAKHYTFSPASRSVTVTSTDLTAENFTGTPSLLEELSR